MLQTQLNALRAKYAWCVLFAHYLRHAFCASAVRLATLLATRQIRQILNPLPNFNPRQILSHAFLRSTLNHPHHAFFALARHTLSYALNALGAFCSLIICASAVRIATRSALNPPICYAVFCFVFFILNSTRILKKIFEILKFKIF